MRILIATDAWHPQVNGVVRTLTRLVSELQRQGATPILLTPRQFASIPLFFYPGMRMALPRAAEIERYIREATPDCIHIATEGPIGWAVRRHCLTTGRRFTTSYHTKFPEYVRKFTGLPEAWFHSLIKRFHGPSAAVMVSTPSLECELRQRGFRRLMRWSRGVDTDVFKPVEVEHRQRLTPGKRPLFLYVGRISPEKNVEAFCQARLPGDKLVVGDGPQLAALAARYPSIRFAGKQTGALLSATYASADVFVFPSRTDTFGLVILEALASGLPVAAYPVTGPVDIIEHGVSGILDEDLAAAACRALQLDRRAARARAETFTWQRSALQFLDNIKAGNGLSSDLAETASLAASRQTTASSTLAREHTA